MTEVFDDSFEEFCYQNNIIISRHNGLSTKVRGFCHYDGQYYNVVLNNSHSTAQLQKTTMHEIIHVLQNHFSCNIEDAYKCEQEVEEIISVIEFAFI